ncbi:MAG TPA: GNAT family N-acetyltransferase, partial [Burkholderiales bacterium]|nr:GNAT family N-acetyltransferase [Burkholderiales bacterium]
KVRRHGLAATLHLAAVKALGVLVEFKILRAVSADRPVPAFLDCPYAARLLDEAELREFARDPASELSAEFLDQALARGDQCYAIVDGGRLAAYGWYAFGPTPLGPPGVTVQFRRGWVYMYKGFTDPAYRGQRLHAIGMTRALEHYREKGLAGIVSYVESSNFDSLKSCFRMGYSAFGTVVLVRLLGRYYSGATPGCRKYGFGVTCSDSSGRRRPPAQPRRYSASDP